MRRRLLLSLSLALPLALVPAHAQAFSTRIHIMIANQIREALIAANDGTIALKLSDAEVILAQEDFEALRDNPLAFRAGAVGPDNMVFPGMTDPSHALGQRPYEQCELLYQAAVNGEERAYALGCFLHGATDAIAHHYVNHMTGETFTLTPITSARASSLDNVVRHILAESAIQDAAYELDPDAFTTGKMLHTIPVGFVLRTYLDQDAPLWQLMATHALGEYEAAKSAQPGASLPTIVASMDVAPADHLVLAPVYLAEVDALIEGQQAALEADVATMQDWNSPDGSQLLVTAGPDGELGTEDDETDCTLTCPTLYATYFTYVGLLAPREDAMGNPLPSAFEKITDELRDELDAFPGAYMETVGNLSAKLNEPLTESGGGFGVTKAELAELFTPLTDWADDITTIDYDTLVYAVVPDWILDLDTALQSVGLDVDIAGILEAVFQPVIQPIKDAIEQAFIAQAEMFIGEIIDGLAASQDAVYAEYDARLAAAAHPDLDGDMLDHLYDSGLFAHAFNITAATMANHAAVLPVGDDPIGVGPASFDASYTPAWMQAGVCPYLAGEIFPLGIDVAGALSVRADGVDYPAQIDQDSPVECHDGSLTSFAAAASVDVCGLTDLDSLLSDPTGSLSRAYPPAFADFEVECENTAIPGLPEPPTEEGGDDETGDESGGEDATDDGGDEVGGSDTSGGGATDSGGQGCACTTTTTSGPGSGGLGWLGVFGLFGLALRRGGGRGRPREAPARRRTSGAALAVTAILALPVASACTDDGGGDEMADEVGTSDGGTEDSETDTGTGTETTEDTGTETDTDTDTESETDSDTGTDSGELFELLDQLDGTSWHGEQTRGGVTRAYELTFDSASLLWSEIRNPYGPARLREMRMMGIGGDLIETTVISPQGWPIHPENGREDEWTLELLDTDPPVLRTTRDTPEGTLVEDFEQGPWPAPTSGLTATVRVFPPGGVVDQAFCDSGLSGFDYAALFNFAHGQSDEIVATDIVAGADLAPWEDLTNNNQFSVTDVDGFGDYGGTELSDTFNFFVTYTGYVDHPGGELAMREQDDSVEDAVWVFLDDGVGSDNVNDLFLEVHGFVWADQTPDEPSANFPGGDVPFEAILVRCTEQIDAVEVEINFQDAGWELVSDVATSPEIDSQLFPPAL